MQIEHLYYLQEVMICGSFSAAAEKLYISQQRLSEIVAKIEKEFQTKIFIRSKKGIRLTPDGEMFMQDINKILEQYELLQKKYAQKNKSTDLRIVINPIMIDLFFEDVLDSFYKAYPQISLTISEKENPYAVLKEVSDLQADLGITSMPPSIYHDKNKSSNLILEDIFLDHLCVLVSVHHPFAQKNSATLEECLEQPLILDNDGLLRKYLDYYIRKLHLDPNYKILATVNDSMYLKMIERNLGIGFIYKFQYIKLHAPEFAAIPIRDTEPCHFMVAYSNQLIMLEPVEHFLQLFLKTLDTKY